MSNIRFMNPCTIQCDSCGEIIPPRRKFNGNKQLLKEKYLDKVKIYTLSFHCPQCHNLLVLQTDPQRADYITKSGCHRLFHDSSSTEGVDTTKGDDVDNDKTKQIEGRLKKLQKQQSQMDELSKIQELQSRIHQQEMLTMSSTKVEKCDGEGDADVNDVVFGFTTKFDSENSIFPRPEKRVSKQFEEESTAINTSDLIKLRTTHINNNNNSKNNNNKTLDKKNSSLSLGVIIKSKKKKGRIVKKK